MGVILVEVSNLDAKRVEISSIDVKINLGRKKRTFHGFMMIVSYVRRMGMRLERCKG